MLETDATPTAIGQLGRRRDAFHTSVVERLEEQRRLLADLTGHPGFADGRGVARARIRGFDRLLERFTAPDRVACASALVAAADEEPRLGFVRLLDPDAQALQSPVALPEHWAAFLLVPVGALVVLEILAGPDAATYVFRGGVEVVNLELQAVHFRRSPLALTDPGLPH